MDDAFTFTSLNSGYIAELYDKFRADPGSVDPETRLFFQQWAAPEPPPADGQEKSRQSGLPAAGIEKIVAAANLAQAIRTLGHLAARLDPLGTSSHGDPALEASAYHLEETELSQIPASVIGGPIAEQSRDAYEAIQGLRRIYSATTGYDYNHVRVPKERDWLRYSAECGVFRPPQADIDLPALLDRLTRVEVFEQFLHRFFPGKTRFSIEGLDILVPMLDEMIEQSSSVQICAMLIGMAHRGRLNVLAHILSKPYSQILAEFKDPGKHYTNLEGLGWTGDVKYHTGANVAVQGDSEQTIKIVVGMPPNPSHLEHVNPIVAGMARAADSGTNRPGKPAFFPSAVLPVLIHGDASFPGEGIVAETLNLSKLEGYTVAGTIHIIANNQLGFTTDARQSRSTLYASDLAKGFEIPIIHVNADDPIACIEAVRTAFFYREKFHKDFLIDLIGYRRYGHNEGDEPSFTQPHLYQAIERHPSVRKFLADQLIEQNAVPAGMPDQLVKDRMEELQKTWDILRPEEEIIVPHPKPRKDQAGEHVKTAVSASRLRKLNQDLLAVPEGFSLNRKLERAIQRRRTALENPDERSIDWAMAEELAFGAILMDGTPIRLTGQDTERGTFSQRHAVFHDAQNDQGFIPLQAIPEAKASFEVYNSPLSENAALGFEYGYNVQSKNSLVIWEAQYGDFVNAAQAIIDEFIVSGHAKWEQKPSLVLLLPHGYEGQGPDHSSGRIERFLRSGASGTADGVRVDSLRIANCTSAAQYFHLLRRQAALLSKEPLPLIIFTPKSLLRHPRVASSLNDLADGKWNPVLDDPEAGEHLAEIQRLIFCSGKIGIDLLDSEERSRRPNVAVLRLEQLTPFPGDEILEILNRYTKANEYYWVQEEPENMGAWGYVHRRFVETFGEEYDLEYVGRSASPSPSEGSLSWHQFNQQVLIAQAFQPHPQFQKAKALLHRD